MDIGEKKGSNRIIDRLTFIVELINWLHIFIRREQAE